MTYRYTVDADVTDEGGETRSASRVVPPGLRRGGGARGSAGRLPPRRQEGRDRPSRARTSTACRAPGRGPGGSSGSSSPRRPLLPADLPPDPSQEPGPEGGLRTPGDALRPRWDTAYDPSRGPARAGRAAPRSRTATSPMTRRGWRASRSPGCPPARTACATRRATSSAPTSRFPGSSSSPARRRRSPWRPCCSPRARSVPVGQTARLFAASGLPGQPIALEIDRDGRPVERRDLTAGQSSEVIEIPIEEKHRGGFGVKLTVLRDLQLVTLTQTVFVPWDDEELRVSFATFRDRMRPGQRETWTRDSRGAEGRAHRERGGRAAGLHVRPEPRRLRAVPAARASLALYPNRTGIAWSRATLGQNHFQHVTGSYPSLPDYPSLPAGSAQALRRIRPRRARAGAGCTRWRSPARPTDLARGGAASGLRPRPAWKSASGRTRAWPGTSGRTRPRSPPPPSPRRRSARTSPRPRSGSRTCSPGPDGSASIEFTVPDSVTSWNVWVQARDEGPAAGSLTKETKSVKELMVRPYLPRFLREGDRAELKVVVNNASDEGHVGQGHARHPRHRRRTRALLADFGLSPAKATLPFTVAAGGGADVTFPSDGAEARRAPYAFKVTAASGELLATASCGRCRSCPAACTSRSRASRRCRDGERRDADVRRPGEGRRPDAHRRAARRDARRASSSTRCSRPCRTSSNYPYECTEQTLNRFLSTGIVSSRLRATIPAVARMAQELSKRDTQLETWDAADPNRQMALEETPWLEEARGGEEPAPRPDRACSTRGSRSADRDAALAKLAQGADRDRRLPLVAGRAALALHDALHPVRLRAGAASSASRCREDMVERAWSYLAATLPATSSTALHGAKDDCCWEFVTFLNYVALVLSRRVAGRAARLTPPSARRSSTSRSSTGRSTRRYLKGHAGADAASAWTAPKDAKLVWDSVMDSAKTTPDEGTFWAPEDRAWLWYNDTIETPRLRAARR